MSNPAFEPAYIEAYNSGRLQEKIRQALRLLEDCSICPRRCGVDRLQGDTGTCESGRQPEVSSYSPHFGEERPLVGRNGSGTIFMTHCNLGCAFCQNYSISHGGDGQRIDSEMFSRIILEMQQIGCHNINFVSPTHFTPQILEALPAAIEGGLNIPIVYNTGGYDSQEVLRLLEGVIDIYMPDLKFMSSEVAARYAQAPDYPQVVKAAIKEMFRQVGDLHMDSQGIAQRGLLVRHLVLPKGLAGTEEAMEFLTSEISPQTYVNIMAQYYPCGHIPPDSPLRRRISTQEYIDAVEAAKKAGLTRLD